MELITKFVNDIFSLTRRTFYGPAGRLRVTQITPPAYGPGVVKSVFVWLVTRVVIAQQRLAAFGVTLTMSHALSCARLYNM